MFVILEIFVVKFLFPISFFISFEICSISKLSNECLLIHARKDLLHMPHTLF